MAVNRRLPWINWLRWDLRMILAILLGVGIVVALSLAAPTGSPLYTFDFGTSSTADVATGAIHVMGGGSIYPKTSGSVQFGWASGSVIQAITRGAAVADKLQRDYNFSPGSSAIFKIGGIPAGDYVARFIVGDNTNKIATAISLQGRTATIIKTATYGTTDLPLTVAGSSDVADIAFSSAATDAGWGINAIQIFKSTTTAPDPTFTVTLSPASQTVRAGGIAVYQVGITPLNSYAGDVALSISGLTAGITAELDPSTLTELPATAQLRLATEPTVAALPYEFLLTARGNDAKAVTKSAVVKLTVTRPDGSGTTTVDPVTGVPTTPTGPISQVPGEEQTAAERKAQFNLIDEYVAAEAANLVNKTNSEEIKTFTEDFVAFPSVPQLPEPKNVVERSLQLLLKTGIIGTAVSNAPRGQEDSGPKSFFQRILDGIVSPLGG